MRRVRHSVTANEQFNGLLAFGEDRYGMALVDEKKVRVYDIVELHLAAHPRTKRLDPADLHWVARLRLRPVDRRMQRVPLSAATTESASVQQSIRP